MGGRRQSKREAASAEERKARAAHQIDVEMQDQAEASDQAFEHAIEEWKNQDGSDVDHDTTSAAETGRD